LLEFSHNFHRKTILQYSALYWFEVCSNYLALAVSRFYISVSVRPVIYDSVFALKHSYPFVYICGLNAVHRFHILFAAQDQNISSIVVGLKS